MKPLEGQMIPLGRLVLGRIKPMCPVCIATATQIVMGAVSGGGLTAAVVRKFRAKSNAEVSGTNEGRIDHEQSDAAPESRIGSGVAYSSQGVVGQGEGTHAAA